MGKKPRALLHTSPCLDLTVSPAQNLSNATPLTGKTSWRCSAQQPALPLTGGYHMSWPMPVLLAPTMCSHTRVNTKYPNHIICASADAHQVTAKSPQNPTSASQT
jgi:hypothetical protein